MKRTLYFYRYTTNPGAIEKYGSNFLVFKDPILEECDNEYILECYGHIRKAIVNNPEELWNESTNNHINYTWFCSKNNKKLRNKFKKLVRDRLTQYENKISEELKYIKNLIDDIEEE